MIKEFFKKLKGNKLPKIENHNPSHETEKPNESTKESYIGMRFAFEWLEEGHVFNTDCIVVDEGFEIKVDEEGHEVQTESVEYVDVVFARDKGGSNVELKSETLKALISPHRIYLHWILKSARIYGNFGI